MSVRVRPLVLRGGSCDGVALGCGPRVSSSSLDHLTTTYNIPPSGVIGSALGSGPRGSRFEPGEGSYVKMKTTTKAVRDIIRCKYQGVITTMYNGIQETLMVPNPFAEFGTPATEGKWINPEDAVARYVKIIDLDTEEEVRNATKANAELQVLWVLDPNKTNGHIFRYKNPFALVLDVDRVGHQQTTIDLLLHDLGHPHPNVWLKAAPDHQIMKVVDIREDGTRWYRGARVLITEDQDG